MATLTGLRPREREVLALVAQGLRNADVAARLSISTQTVKSHLWRIYIVLGVTNRTGAVAAYWQAQRGG